jgi:choline-sulfatase
VFDLAGYDLRRQVAAYAGEIAWTDAVVGRLLEGLPASAPVVVVADHGESLTEHGDFLNHGTSLYEPAIRVPVVVRASAGIPRVVDAPVSTLRVAPTLRFLGGLPPGAPTLLDPPDGAWIQSWAPTQRSRVALDLGSAWRVAWRRGPVKWIVDAQGRVERHDLDADPEERVDASAGDPETSRMRELGRALLEDLRNADHAAVPEAMDGVREALEALGYAEPAAAP